MFVVSREIAFKADLPADTAHREAVMAGLREKLDEWANDWDLGIMARPRLLPFANEDDNERTQSMKPPPENRDAPKTAT